jgi:hypothetical protein
MTQSLVVNKRTLPVILRNSVPPLIVNRTAVAQLIATPSRLWGALNSDVGKRIKHGDQIAVITNVHDNLRQLEIDDDRFWVPRRAEDRRSFRESRRKRRMKTVFVPPSWTGSPRPSGADTVQLRSVTDFDHKTIKSLTSSGGLRSSWRFGSGGVSDYDREQLQLQQKEKRKRDLLTVLNNSKSRMSTAMSNAVFDVLIDGSKVGQAASSRGLNPRSLSMTMMRVTQRLSIAA